MCDDGDPKDSPPEVKREAVTERVNARWAALIKGDMDTAYTFLSPASRAVTSLSAYKAEARGKGFREAKIEKVECEAETCKVTLMVVYDHPKMKGIPTLDQEYWVIDDGQVLVRLAALDRAAVANFPQGGFRAELKSFGQERQAVIRFARCWF